MIPEVVFILCHFQDETLMLYSYVITNYNMQNAMKFDEDIGMKMNIAASRVTTWALDF